MQAISRFAAAGFLFSSACLIPFTAMAQTEISSLPLPMDAAYPEGVAVDPVSGKIYLNSASTGFLVRVDPVSGSAEVVADPLKRTPEELQLPGSYALGLKVDAQGRAWVAGGRSGSAHVINSHTGQTLARLTTPPTTGLLNDVVLTENSAFFTDTRRPMLWRASTDSLNDGPLEPWLSLENSPIAYGEGANLNGIAASQDGKYLIVVHMGHGKLFRISTEDRQIEEIMIHGGSLEGGDGLLIHGDRLFVVRQPAQEIVALKLSDDLLHAQEIKRISSPVLKWPATLAISGDRLIVGNSQLNQRPSNTPNLPFDLAIVPLSAFD